MLHSIEDALINYALKSSLSSLYCFQFYLNIYHRINSVKDYVLIQSVTIIIYRQD